MVIFCAGGWNSYGFREDEGTDERSNFPGNGNERKEEIVGESDFTRGMKIGKRKICKVRCIINQKNKYKKICNETCNYFSSMVHYGKSNLSRN